MDSLQLFISLELIFWSYVVDFPLIHLHINAPFLSHQHIGLLVVVAATAAVHGRRKIYFINRNYFWPFIFFFCRIVFTRSISIYYLSGHLKINCINILQHKIQLTKCNLMLRVPVHCANVRRYMWSKIKSSAR